MLPVLCISCSSVSESLQHCIYKCGPDSTIRGIDMLSLALSHGMECGTCQSWQHCSRHTCCQPSYGWRLIAGRQLGAPFSCLCSCFVHKPSGLQTWKACSCSSHDSAAASSRLLWRLSKQCPSLAHRARTHSQGFTAYLAWFLMQMRITCKEH